MAEEDQRSKDQEDDANHIDSETAIGDEGTIDNEAAIDGETTVDDETGKDGETAVSGAHDDELHPADKDAIAIGLETAGELAGSARATLAAASVLLSAILGDRIPKGSLGPSSVPAKLMSIPIALLTEDLVEHLKRCKRSHCDYFPPSLLRFQRTRPGTLRSAPNEVHKALWLHPHHKITAKVRKKILAENATLVNDVSTGRITEGPILEEVLNAAGGAQRLAAVLWAVEFAPAAADMLFRALVPLGQQRTPASVAHSGVDPKELRREIHKLEHAIESSKKHEADTLTRLKAKERALEKAKSELEKERENTAYAQEQISVLEEQVSDAGATLRVVEATAERSSGINAQLRIDLRCRQDELRNLEDERGDLAGRLASQRRATENAQRSLENQPSGSEATWDFLRAEDARIQQARIIKSGGDKARADEEWKTHRKLETAFLDAFPHFREPPPVRIRPKSSLRLVTLGGSGEVGRSCYLLEIGKNRILVDCGIKPRTPEDLLPEISRLDRVDALILTHAHTDHVAWVPALMRRFPELDVYCSSGTAALLPVVLEDCYQHYVRKLAKRQHHARFGRTSANVEEDYDQDDVRAVAKHAIECELEKEEALPFGEIFVRFFQAGHILGASSVLVGDRSGRRVFFSGDFSSFPQLTVPAARWLEEIGDVDLLVLESTYGYRDRHPPLEESREKLLQFLRETLGAGGSVILASFALGRAQELLKLIATAQLSGSLPDVPVFADGMITKVNPIYRRLATFDLSRDAFNEVSGNTERQEVAMSAQLKPTLIVTTSGMLAGGPVVEYARRLLPEARNRIVLTGYQDEGAPSRALLDITSAGRSSRTVRLEGETGEPIVFEAAMAAKEFKLSSHADRAGLLEYSAKLRPKNIALVHGEPASQKELSHYLSELHPKAEISCGPGELPIP